MAEAQAVDTQKVNKLIEEILGPNRDGTGGQLLALGERVSSGNRLLADLTTRVQNTITMINQLRTAQKELEQGKGQVQENLDIQKVQGDAELKTLRTELIQAEKNANEAEEKMKKAEEKIQETADAAAKVAATEAAEAAAAAKQEADTAVKVVRDELANAERRHTADRAMLVSEYNAVMQALDTINKVLEQRNTELNTVLQDLQKQAQMIPPHQAAAQSPAPAPAPAPASAPAPAPCGSNMKRDSTRCPDENFPCLSDKNCYQPNVAAYMKLFSNKKEAVPPPTQGGKRRKSQRVKKSHKRKHHKTRKGKGGWQVSKPKSKKSRKSHRK